MRAFTLIEVLTTVVLLALMASLGAFGLAGASESARWRDAASTIRSTDRQARSLAKTSGTVILTLNDSRNRLRLHAEGSIVMEREISLQAHLVDLADSPIDELHFEPTGRTSDYLVVLTDGERQEQVRFSGLTGWIQP